MVTKLCGEHTIAGGWGPASLDMSEHDIARFDLCAFLDLSCEPFRDPSQTDRFGRVFNDAIDDLVAAFGFGAFGRGDNRESLPSLRSLDALFDDDVDIELNLWDQDDVSPTRDSCVERDPSRVASHELDHHDAVMRRGGRVDTIERLSRDVDRGLESEGDVRAVEVVVDGFGDPDAVESLVRDFLCDGHGAVTPNDHQRVDFADFEVRHADIRQVLEDRVSLLVLPDRVVLGIGSVVGSDDRSALGEDVGDIVQIERSDAILDETQKAVLDPENLDAVVDRVFGDCSDDGVEARTVAASCQDSDAFDVGRWDAILDGGHGFFRL